MIELRPKGLHSADLESIVGRIVMIDMNSILLEYTKPVKVLSYSGKTLVVDDLTSKLDAESNLLLYEDKVERTDGRGYPLQFRTVKLICDTAAEVNAIRALQRQIGDEHTAFIKAIPGRIRQLSETLAPGHEPSA